jgi:hypothetical protein
MLKKLERDSLTADLATVNALLAARSSETDPIGYYQFSHRKRELEQKLEELGAQTEHHAELGVFFGGGPVQGSRGINADFAGKALEELQLLITKRYSEVERGPLRATGRIPLADRSKMLVTSVVRGSFGFMLEEASDTAEMMETPLRTVVDEVSALMARMGASDEESFNEAVATIDQRILVTLRDFFVTLDEHGATMRLVIGDRDFLLDRRAVTLARERAQKIEIDERGEALVGTVYVLPGPRKFELETVIDGESISISGSLGRDAVAQLSGQEELDVPPIDKRNLSQRTWRVEVQIKTIRERNRAPRSVYKLLRLLGEVEPAN